MSPLAMLEPWQNKNYQIVMTFMNLTLKPWFCFPKILNLHSGPYWDPNLIWTALYPGFGQLDINGIISDRHRQFLDHRYSNSCFLECVELQADLGVIITDRVRSTREGYVLTRVCPSVCPHLGVPWPGPAGGGGDRVPQPGPGEGVPWWGGTPPQVLPPSDLARGYPNWGYPTSGTPPTIGPGCGGGTLMGGDPTSGTPIRPGWGVPHLRYPSIRPGWGTRRGVPHLRYPCKTWPGGTLMGYPNGGTPPRVPPIGPGPVQPGGTLARSRWEGTLMWGYLTSGTPLSDLAGGYPTSGTLPLSDLARGVPWRGDPTLGTPYWTWLGGTLTGGTPTGRGYPTLGTPHQTWLGGGYPDWGGPHLGYPPCLTWPGEYPTE